MIPLIEILFLIAVNLVPADIQSFSIQGADNGTNRTHFIRQTEGGWEVKAPKSRSGTWRLDTTKVFNTRAAGGSETDLAQLLTIPTNPDWRTLKEVKSGKTIIQIDRQPAGAIITFKDGENVKQCYIQWAETQK